jgi:hypothetical protein
MAKKKGRRIKNWTGSQESEEPPVREVEKWWRIPGDGRCHECRKYVRENAPMAYCHELRRALCEICWERAGVVPMPSQRWQAARGRRRNPEPMEHRRRSRTHPEAWRKNAAWMALEEFAITEEAMAKMRRPDFLTNPSGRHLRVVR